MQINDNLKHLLQSIIAAEQQFARKQGSVKLLAVSKTQPVEQILAAIQAGQLDFGENYAQEAMAKITAVQDKSINWHFIGALQSNKIKLIAQHFAWVHSLDNLQHAERLSTQRPQQLSPLNICIQVNVDDENTKSGISLTELPSLAHAITKLPHLQLRGLMTIPAPREEFVAQREPFRKLRLALESLNKQGLSLDTLSMGMSNDYLAAIAEGATIIRIGTAIFGARIKSNKY